MQPPPARLPLSSRQAQVGPGGAAPAHGPHPGPSQAEPGAVARRRGERGTGWAQRAAPAAPAAGQAAGQRPSPAACASGPAGVSDGRQSISPVTAAGHPQGQEPLERRAIGTRESGQQKGKDGAQGNRRVRDNVPAHTRGGCPVGPVPALTTAVTAPLLHRETRPLHQDSSRAEMWVKCV